MSSIVLTTLNARYWHSSFGLRYLLANMGSLQNETTLLEFGIGDRTVDVLSAILSHQPAIVGIGVYIWNVDQVTRLVADLKQLRPDIILVLGGPEVSYETESQTVTGFADYVITGEADLAFPELCHRLLKSPQTSNSCSGPTIIHAGVPQLSEVRLPYDYYSEEDLAHRVIYVEVSRGCPFTCEFCLSALDIPVRLFDVDQFLQAMQKLLDRGARQFKFVDRTFNLNLRVSAAILEFFLERLQPELFLHFEMIPDRLPESLRNLITKFPDGVLQFEIGVQTFNDDVGTLISRRQDVAALKDNFRFLRKQTGVHIHADLIVGLPGESLESFAAGFDQLLELDPQEIQVGILKRLKGTPIIRHDAEWQMVYSRHPPFEILSNRMISFQLMHRLRRFARYWDLVANSGNFRQTVRLLRSEAGSAFERFLSFSDWLYEARGQTHGIPLPALAEALFVFLTTCEGIDSDVVAGTIWTDYARNGRRDKPKFLQKFTLPPAHEVASHASSLPSRQARHAD
ncbi:MAG: radical SAM protein [Planctomycetaceae bacterium]